MQPCIPGSREEQRAGFVVSVIVGVITTIATAVLDTLGVPVTTNIAITSIAGNLLGFAGDILFAKRCFPEGQGRLEFLVRALFSRTFIRFLLILVIDVVVSSAVTRSILRTLDRLEIQFRFRDSVVALAVTAITFNVFVNQMRFRYAYAEDVPIQLDVLVFAWSTTLLVLYIDSPSTDKRD